MLFKTLRVSNSNSNYYDNTDERYTTSNDLTRLIADRAYAGARLTAKAALISAVPARPGDRWHTRGLRTSGVPLLSATARRRLVIQG
jgi:hypothetical protein